MYTDQKPLIYAFKQNPDKCSPRQWRHLDYISHFSTDVRYVSGDNNIVADALSRIEKDQIFSSFLDFEEFAKIQENDVDLCNLQTDSKSYFVFKSMLSPMSSTELICDVSTGSPRPFVPANYYSSFTGALKSILLHYDPWGKTFAVYFNSVTQL